MCHGAALRQEMSFHKREILRRFREACGAPVKARELVLLESDAMLSSLVREAEESEARRGGRETSREDSAPGAGASVIADEPAPSSEAVEEEPSLAARVAAAYPRFDGAAYREELRRIAEGD